MEEEGEREAGWEEEEEEEEAEVEPKARDAFDRKNKSHRNKKKKPNKGNRLPETENSISARHQCNGQ